MASTTTTQVCDTFKTELLQGAHMFSASVSGLTTTGVSTTHITSISGAGISGISVGMNVSGTQVAAGSVVSVLVSQTALDLNLATTGTSSALVFSGDTFKILLIASGAAGNISYGQGTSNVGTPATGTPSQTNVGTDEVAASGAYSAGGQALASNVAPSQPGSVAHVSTTSWSANPSWAASTLSVIGAIIYNTAVRLGAAANGITANLGGSAINRAVSVHDFGGTQAVTSGTLTLTLPSNTGSLAILRIA